MKTNKKSRKNYKLLSLAMAVIMTGTCLYSSMDGAFTASADSASTREYGAVVISNLEVNGSEKPLGIDDANPVFSWQLSSEARGKKQSAYQIVVKEGSETVWDSTKITAENNYGVLYGGTALKSKTLYDWTVKVWDENDEECATESSTFETGIMSQDEWTASWIGAPTAPDMSFNGANWIWDRDGHNVNEIPEETLYFRRKISLDTSKVDYVRIAMSADDNARLYINGNSVLPTLNIEEAWKSAAYTTVSASALEEENVIAVEATNTSNGYAGLLAKIEVYYTNSSAHDTYVTDGSWKISDTKDAGWNTLSFDDSGWKTLTGDDVIPYGSNPWGNNVSFAGGEGSSAPILRKQFSTDGKTVKSARAYIVGLGLYDLKINGKNPYDSVLNPANTDYSDTVLYDVYDVTEALNTGDNAISVELGNGFYNMDFGGWGWSGSPWKDNPKLRFELDITYTDGSTQKVYSNSDWKYYGGGPTTSNRVYHGETYDARNAAEFSLVSYDDSAWQNAGIVSAPGGKLVWQDMEQMKKTAFFGSESGAEGALAVNYSSSTQKTTVTVPRMITGWSKIVFRNTSPGQQIVIDYGEIIGADGNLERKEQEGIFQRDTYICKGVSGNEVEVFEPKFTYKGFQYVQVSNYTGLTADDVTCYMINTDVASTARFSSSNEMLNTLHGTMVNTLLNNYQGKPTDTPYLEKNGWLGDVNIALETMGFDFDIARFMKKFLGDIRDSQQADGKIPLIAPFSGQFGNENYPVWTTVYIFAVDELVNTYGMGWLVPEFYESLKKLMDLDVQKMGTSYVWEDDYNNLGDWVSPIGNENGAYSEHPYEDSSLYATAYIYEALGVMVKYATSVGETEDAASYAQVRENVLSAFNAKYLNNGIYTPSSYYSADLLNRTQYRQSANILPLAFGMVPEQSKETVVANLVKDIKDKDYHLDTGVIGTKYILPVLSDNGYSDVAYRILTQKTYPSWGYWLEKGATSLWEMWESTARSHDHYFLGTYDEWFFSYLGGVKDVVDGYKSFTLEPLMAGDLKTVDVSLDTVRGNLAIKWELKAQNIATFNVTVPFGSTAKFVLPTSSASGVTLDGAALSDTANGVESVAVENGKLTVVLGSGSFAFVCTADKRDIYSGTLTELVATAEKFEEIDYKAEGWTKFSAALTEAKDVLTNTSSTQEQIDAASSKLQAAITELSGSVNTYRVALKASVQDIMNSGVMNLSYADGAKDEFIAALSAANKATRNSELNEEQMKVEYETFERAVVNLLSNCKENFAKLKSVSLSSSSSVSAENDGWNLQYINDGVTDGTATQGWSSSNLLSSQHEEWVRLDFGSSYYIDRIVIYAAGEHNGTYYGMPRDFVIEVSNDGENFIAVAEKTGYTATEAAQTFTFDKTNARYLRVRGTKLNVYPHESNTYRMQLAEIEVYNTVSANKSALAAQIERYNALQRNLYTTDSLMAVEDVIVGALEIYEANVGESEQATVDKAASDLKNALDNLVLKEQPEPAPAPDGGGNDIPDNNGGENKLNVGALVGGIVGGVVVIGAGVAVTVILLKRKKNK